MLRALAALGLLPLLVAAGDDVCRLCTSTAVPLSTADTREIPLSIDITTKLDFSRAALTHGGGGGAIEIDPDSGGRRMAGGLIDIGGTAVAGAAVVRGAPGRQIRVDMPPAVRMTSSTGSVIEISGLHTNLAHNPRLDASGRLSFSFGGKLLVQGSATGTFRGRIPITAQYE